MHSSRMHTARSLLYRGREVSVQGGGLCSGGLCLSRGLCPGGLCPWGSLSGRPIPPVNRMTHRCKNIALPQTSFAGGKNRLYRSLQSSFTNKYLPSETELPTFLANNAYSASMLTSFKLKNFYRYFLLYYHGKDLFKIKQTKYGKSWQIWQSLIFVKTGSSVPCTHCRSPSIAVLCRFQIR